ncbi:nuclear transport factor 2 family protein [Streptomyces sp. NPDC055025]
MTMTPMDYENIRQLQARYSLAVDFGDRAAFEACFTSDGAFCEKGLPEGLPDQIHIEGRLALGDFVELFFSAGQGHLRHWSSPPLIEGEGDEATGMSFLMVLRPGSAPNAGVLLTGVYRDRYRKIDDRWYFAERVFSADPQPEHRQNRSKDPLVGRLDTFVARLRRTGSVPPVPREREYREIEE